MQSRRLVPLVLVHFLALVLGAVVYARAAKAQVEPAVDEWRGRGQVVVPHLGGFPLDGSAALYVTDVHWTVDVAVPLARVSVEVGFLNAGHQVAEAEMILPVPQGVAIRGMDFFGAGSEPSARLLDAEEARRSYRAIVARSIDPALLEFAGRAAIRTSVFPVPARGKQRVRIDYEEVLEGDGTRYDLVLPRSEAWRHGGPPMSLDLLVSGLGQGGTVWSPTHDLVSRNERDGTLRVGLAPGALEQPGSVRVALMPGAFEPGATLYAHPDLAGGGGTFLLLCSLPVAPSDQRQAKELALVIDCSGSMNGPKFQQVREAAKRALDRLEPGDSFQLVAFSGEVEPFTRGPELAIPERVQEAKAWLEKLVASGATNLSDAIGAVLHKAPLPGVLPVVLLLTDGMPTAGIRGEVELLDWLGKSNPHARRLNVMGVGHDVNAPLLDRMAALSRARSQYVHPGEDAGLAMEKLARRLAAPRAVDLSLDYVDPAGQSDPQLASSTSPAVLEDLFDGEQLALVGRYRAGATHLGVRLAGKLDGIEGSWEWHFSLDHGSPHNAFVSRTWAQRRIADLVDLVRAAGAAPNAGVRAEWVEEIRHLSQKWGVLSEYTAFLALEGTDLANNQHNRAALASGLVQRAQRVRTGAGGVVQAVNQGAWRRGHRVDRLNRFLNEQLNWVGTTRVQHIGERAFYLRSGKWVDARLFEGGEQAAQSRQLLASVPFGSDHYQKVCEWLEQRDLASVLSLPGDVLLEVEGRALLLPKPQRPPVAAVQTPADAAQVGQEAQHPEDPGAEGGSEGAAAGTAAAPLGTGPI